MSHELQKEEGMIIVRKLAPCYGQMHEVAPTAEGIAHCDETCPAFEDCSIESVNNAAKYVAEQLSNIPDPFLKKLLEGTLGKSVKKMATQITEEKSSHTREGKTPSAPGESTTK